MTSDVGASTCLSLGSDFCMSVYLRTMVSHRSWGNLSMTSVDKEKKLAWCVEAA